MKEYGQEKQKGLVPMSYLYANQLTLAYDKRVVVEGLKLSIPQGEITAIGGANGSGKSTILKAMARILRPNGGAVYLDGKAIHTQPTRRVAQQLAILPQGPEAPEQLKVEELVSYGRFPYQTGFGVLTRDDRHMIAWALSVTGMSTFADRPVNSLSGGERQRAWIAMALAQGTGLLLLDEPTTFLDIAHQFEVLQLLKRLNVEEGRTVVMVLHDLNHAARFANHLVIIAEGKVITKGAPWQVLTPEVLRRAFGIEADIVPDPRSGAPLCIPYGLSLESALQPGQQLESPLTH